MKAIEYRRYGPPEVLAITQVARPTPGDGEVLIRVHAAEATKADVEMRSFRFAVLWFWLPLRLAVGLFRPRRRVLGGYFAGEIVDLGVDAKGFSIGDRVYGSAGIRMGAYAEYLALPANASLARMPGNMSYTEAAAVPLGGLNALHFMRLAETRPGEQVLINGAGGSIGAHAVQIASSMGAVVTAVDAAPKQELLERLGADHFVDYRQEDFSQSGRLYDVIFDMVPTSNYTACIKSLRRGGRYLSGNPTLSLMLRSVFTTRFSDKTVRFAFAAETVDELNDLREMIESGDILPIVEKTYPMEEAAQAHERVETERRRGAIVIEIG